MSKGNVSRLRDDLPHLGKGYVSTPKRLTEELRGWLAKAVAARLRVGESPYSITVSLTEKGLSAPGIESILAFVDRDAAKGGTLWIFLPMKRKRRRPHRRSRLKDGPIPSRVDISTRPDEANGRSRVGDGEGDTVHGTGPDGRPFRPGLVLYQGAACGLRNVGSYLRRVFSHAQRIGPSWHLNCCGAEYLDDSPALCGRSEKPALLLRTHRPTQRLPGGLRFVGFHRRSSCEAKLLLADKSIHAGNAAGDLKPSPAFKFLEIGVK